MFSALCPSPRYVRHSQRVFFCFCFFWNIFLVSLSLNKTNVLPLTRKCNFHFKLVLTRSENTLS